MTFLRRVLPAFVLVASLSAASSAQSYPVSKVVVQGGAPYTDEEILSIAQLKPGDVLTKNTFANAAQHLLDTGLFDNAEMELGGPGNHTAVLELKPTPLDKLMATSFENFVWWTPAELNAELHKRMPIFHGVASDAGNIPDLITAALVQMLAEKGVTATVEHTFVEPTTLQPRRTVSFAIATPVVRLQHISLQGVPPALDTEDLHKAIRNLEGGKYNEWLSNSAIQNQLLGSARRHGYILATLEDVKRTPSQSNGEVLVDYAATLQPGDAYTLSSVSFQPGTLFTADQFAQVQTLHAGDSADSSLMFKQENAVLQPYLAQGYLYAYVARTLTPDAAAHTAAYSISVVPGEVYRLRTLNVIGLSPDQRQFFDAHWKMKSGDLYDATYFAAFLRSTVGHGQGPLADCGALFDLQPDSQAHTVDMTVTYMSGR